MFYVMIEITSFLQLQRLNPLFARDINERIINSAINHGGVFVKEQSGLFLISFHPSREKVLSLVSEFVFLTLESLQGHREDLFGFNCLWEESKLSDEALVFSELKKLLFLAPADGQFWVGPQVALHVHGVFPVEAGDYLVKIVGPQTKKVLQQLSFSQLLEMTGWCDALSGPLDKQLQGSAGRILRIRGNHPIEKLFFVVSALKRSFKTDQAFPVIFPLQNTQDYFSQLLALVDQKFSESLTDFLAPEDTQLWNANPQWQFLLCKTTGAKYPGDHTEHDIKAALLMYFHAQLGRLHVLNLPPIFVFVAPQSFSTVAAKILEELLSPLIESGALRVVILEPVKRPKDFLSGLTSVVWDFPALSLAKLEQERKRHGWNLVLPDDSVLELCQDRGASLAHWLWGVQEGKLVTSSSLKDDPSWTLLESLDVIYQKVYLAFLLGEGLLDVESLGQFFSSLGEDSAVVSDRIAVLQSLGYITLETSNIVLRSDFRARLVELLGLGGQEILSHFGRFIFGLWKKEGQRFSEIIFQILWQGKEYDLALEVLTDYVNHKINRGEGDFLPLLRPSLWNVEQSIHEKGLLSAAAFKLRFALFHSKKKWEPVGLDIFRKHFTPQTESFQVLEWTLQCGRFQLFQGQHHEGFSLLKKTLLTAQEQHRTDLEIRAGIDIGYSLLSRKKIDDARDYFSMAERLAEGVLDLYNSVRAGFLHAVARFLAGELSGVGKVLDRLEVQARRTGLHEILAGIDFMRARIAFEFGQYEQTITYLERCVQRAQAYELSDVFELSKRWIARSLSYLGRYSEADEVFGELTPSAEGKLFQAEKALFFSNPESALEILSGAPAAPSVEPYTGERLSFTTGYSLLEDRLVGERGGLGVLAQQSLAMTAYLQALSGQNSTALVLFREILSNKSLIDTSPIGPSIYLWYAHSLEVGPENEAHRLTLLGRGLKSLQMRASCIDDPQLRQEYQNRPYWNAKFFAEARKSKLI